MGSSLLGVCGWRRDLGCRRVEGGPAPAGFARVGRPDSVRHPAIGREIRPALRAGGALGGREFREPPVKDAERLLPRAVIGRRLVSGL